MILLYILFFVLAGCSTPKQEEIKPWTSPGMSVDAQDR